MAQQTISGASASMRADELATLYRLTDALYRAGGYPEIYEAALDAITAVLGTRASILLFDEAGVMRFVAWRGLSDAYRRKLEGHTPWKPDDVAPEPIFVEDIENTDEPTAVKDAIKAEGIRGLAFIPLLSRQRVIGKFMTYYAEPHPFPETEVQLAVTIARQLGFGLERARTDEALRESESRLKLLLAELNHRIKNTLAVVQAIAHQTFRHGGATTDARRAFEGRLIALAAAHNLLTQSEWKSASLRAIATDVLNSQSIGPGRASLEGPDVELAPKQALALALALHELCTNATKYGALSNDTGEIAIHWFRRPKGGLTIRWQEHGGPAVSPPVRRGFGSRLIEQSLSRDLDAKVTLDFRPEGLSCTIESALAVADDS